MKNTTPTWMDELLDRSEVTWEEYFKWFSRDRHWEWWFYSIGYEPGEILFREVFEDNIKFVVSRRDAINP